MDSLTSPVLAGMVNRKAEVSIVGAADARLHLFYQNTSASTVN
jgi:hypothetical protein